MRVQQAFLLGILSVVGQTQSGASDSVVVCPRAGRIDSSTTLETFDPTKKFLEISGLAISPTMLAPSKQPVFYGIDDGNVPRLGVWDAKTGERLLTFVLPVTFQDMESLDIGPCGNTTCLYVADIGDNTARGTVGNDTSRPNAPYQIVRIQEPDYRNYSDNETLPEDMISVLQFDYLNSTNAPTRFVDSEAIFVDPVGWGEGSTAGDVYLASKWGGESSRTLNRLFKIPVDAWDTYAGQVFSPQVVGDYSPFVNGLPNNFLGRTWRRAASTVDGTVIALGDKSHTILFLRCPGATVSEALFTTYCERWKNPPGQMESTAFTPDGAVNLQIPEGSKSPMDWTYLHYDGSRAVCPELQYVNGECQSVSGSSFPTARCEAVNAPSLVMTPSPTPASVASLPVGTSNNTQTGCEQSWLPSLITGCHISDPIFSTTSASHKSATFRAMLLLGLLISVYG